MQTFLREIFRAVDQATLETMQQQFVEMSNREAQKREIATVLRTEIEAGSAKITAGPGWTEEQEVRRTSFIASPFRYPNISYIISCYKTVCTSRVPLPRQLSPKEGFRCPKVGYYRGWRRPESKSGSFDLHMAICMFPRPRVCTVMEGRTSR